MQSRETGTPSLDGAFRISTRRLEHGIALYLVGDVDIATASIVEDELRRAEESEDLIVLDLEDVAFMDSTGLRMVISADHRLRERGGALQISHVPPQVEKLFRLVGILDHLDIDDRLDGRPEPAIETQEHRP